MRIWEWEWEGTREVEGDEGGDSWEGLKELAKALESNKVLYL